MVVAMYNVWVLKISRSVQISGSLTVMCNAQYSVRMTMNDDLLQSQILEVRRGSVVIATLALAREPQYGYALIELLSEAGIEAEANTLYPLLRRLEKQGLLESVWNTEESRPRKYYQTTPEGDAMRAALLEEWNRLNINLKTLNGESS